MIDRAPRRPHSARRRRSLELVAVARGELVPSAGVAITNAPRDVRRRVKVRAALYLGERLRAAAGGAWSAYNAMLYAAQELMEACGAIIWDTTAGRYV